MFKNSFTGDLPVYFWQSGNYLITALPPHRWRVAALPCEMFALQNRCGPDLSEANSHARRDRSKQLSKNIHPTMSASFCSLTKSYLQWLHRKTYRMSYWTHIRQRRAKTPAHMHNQRPVTDGISQVHQSQLVHSTPVWHLSITQPGLVWSVPARHSQVFSEFFIFQQGSAPVQRQS